MLIPRRLCLPYALVLAVSTSMAWGQNLRPLSREQDSGYQPAQRSLDAALERNSELARYLNSAGILNRTGPYRIALPLASFGEHGPKLLFTYVPRMKDGTGSKVFMFFIRADLD